MMLTHNWFEQQEPEFQEGFRLKVAGAVQFDCGDVNVIPLARGTDFFDARSPFPVVVLQFETPTMTNYSHALVLWEELDDGIARMVGAFRGKTNGRWSTFLPRLVSRHGDNFHYQSVGVRNESNDSAVLDCHSMAKRLFDVLACSNVATVTTPAAASLNKKRAKSGKFPILEYKTLTIIVDEQRSVSEPQGGTHASPRVHLRRGHIRRIAPEKRIWVQPCVVGSNHGIVLKDYRVRTKGVA